MFRRLRYEDFAADLSLATTPEAVVEVFGDYLCRDYHRHVFEDGPFAGVVPHAPFTVWEPGQVGPPKEYWRSSLKAGEFYQDVGGKTWFVAWNGPDEDDHYTFIRLARAEFMRFAK